MADKLMGCKRKGSRMKAASCIVLLGIGGLLASIPGHAGSLSSTVTLTSDYLFDGVSQTQNAPAMQASL